MRRHDEIVGRYVDEAKDEACVLLSFSLALSLGIVRGDAVVR